MSKRRFFIALDTSDTPEIDFKALVRSGNHDSDGKQEPIKKEKLKDKEKEIDRNGNREDDEVENENDNDDDEDESDGKSNQSAVDEEIELGHTLPTPRNARYNIIERLEKRYGGARAMVSSERRSEEDSEDYDEEDEFDERREDDDLYDSEDSFIDDSELYETIEELHKQTKVKTKHSGFFVNAGEEIETIYQEDTQNRKRKGKTKTVKKRKKPKQMGTESSKAVKEFLDEWGDAAAEWQPGTEVMQSIDALKARVREVSASKPLKKVFPRELDDTLRAVDKLVVGSHPNKWRVNGYFATLMTFLPFTKAYLKANMLRLEARDACRGAKDELDAAFNKMTEYVPVYTSKAENNTEMEPLKEEILKDKTLATYLYNLMQALDDWISKENEYRLLLKNEDKKNMEERDYIQLNIRQERNKMLNRVSSLLPTGLIDMPSLRTLSRSGKPRSRKNPQSKAKTTSDKKPSVETKENANKTATISPKTTATKSASDKPKPAKKPKNKVSASVDAAGGGVSNTESKALNSKPSTPVSTAKRVSRAPKTRVIDECPPFNDADFE